MLKIGSLCTGYGGLDMATEAFFNAETVWTCEFDKYASKIIEKQIVKPNHGNLKTTDWNQVEPIDILTAGYPCQPFSHAGLRKGTEDERHLWPYIKEIIGLLRPQFVVLENVRGHFTLGFREVLGDLASLGYDARWRLIRASDVGAPHRRERLFILAYPNRTRQTRSNASNLSAHKSWHSSSDTDEHTRTHSQRCHLGKNYGNEVEYQGQSQLITSRLVETVATHTHSHTRSQSRRTSGEVRTESIGLRGRAHEGQARGKFRFSVEMDKETIPPPLDQGKLNVKFVEYMMGLPNGWVTDVGLPRSQMLKILGNGVVPQQAYRALELLHTYPQALSTGH